MTDLTENSENHSVINEANDDPYAYVTRNDFTSEKFKVEIKNLPKYFGVKASIIFLKKNYIKQIKITFQ